MLEGDSAAEVEGIDSNTGKKCYMFETRKEMKNYLFNRVKKEKEAEEMDKETIFLVFDELTKTSIPICLYDLKKYGKEKAIELGREREKEARLAELAKAETQKQ